MLPYQNADDVSYNEENAALSVFTNPFSKLEKQVKPSSAVQTNILTVCTERI